MAISIIVSLVSVAAVIAMVFLASRIDRKENTKFTVIADGKLRQADIVSGWPVIFSKTVVSFVDDTPSVILEGVRNVPGRRGSHLKILKDQSNKIRFILP